MESVPVVPLQELQRGSVLVQAGPFGIAVFLQDGKPIAFDNRCLHSQMPLAKGQLRQGILTCAWHRWRYDVASGACMNSPGQALRSYPAWERDGQIWLELREPSESDLDVRVALESGRSWREVVQGLAIFAASRSGGWLPELGALSAAANLLGLVDSSDLELEAKVLEPVAQAIGLACVDALALHPRASHPCSPGQDGEKLEVGLRAFVKKREVLKAERCLLSLLALGWNERRMANVIFSAITDSLLADDGYSMKSANQAFELLRQIGWAHAPRILPLLMLPLCQSNRAEDELRWRRPYDFVGRIQLSLEEIEGFLDRGARLQWKFEEQLVASLSARDPDTTFDSIDEAICQGARAVDLGRALALASVLGDRESQRRSHGLARILYHAARLAPSDAVLPGVYQVAAQLCMVRLQRKRAISS